MLFYYASAGLVANFGLAFNMLFILGVLGQLNAALTLTGIAGIVLTIGMAIDANVLIFERIREEIRRGVPIKLAVQQGYQKALSSIIDSNCTTLIIGIVLYLMSEGSIKGFATTLVIGIFCSVFTAVFVTRLILELFDKFVGIERMRFSFSFTRDFLTGFNFDFLRFSRFAYVFSLLFIATGGALIYQQGGLNLGVDFTGGRTYIVKFGKPIEPDIVRESLSKTFKDASTKVKNYGDNSILKITTGYKVDINDAETDEEVKKQLVASLAKQTGLTCVTHAEKDLEANTFTISSSSKVGPTAADQVKEAAQKALLLCLLLIFLYILFRFRRWQFSLAAVVALLHDVLCIFAAFAIARAFGVVYDIDQVFVASILTVVGYSINDTVVVFDRVREIMAGAPNLPFSKVVNRAINETISRTLITSLTTLLAVLSLFILGGEGLRSFSFAMLVGIFVGTYSSICIATPLAKETIKD